MPYDEGLANQMRTALENHVGISEKRMMGGVCFFLNGNMLSGARRDKDSVRRFMFRVGKENEAVALQNPTARPVIHGTRKLGGFVFVLEEECEGPALHNWLSVCLGHAASLPAKA
ncbi:MAG: hypothetical protein ABJQ34_03000 [Paracoccaceae bacterium]